MSFAGYTDSDPLTGDCRSLFYSNEVQGILGNGVLTGVAVSERGAGANMSVDVSAGTWIANATAKSTSSVTNVVITAADPTNDRYDLIYSNSAGTIAVSDGTPASDPQVPDLPANSIGLAIVSVPATDTSIEDAQIEDARFVFNSMRFTIASGIFSGASISMPTIPAGFRQLSLKFLAVLGTATTDIVLRFNNDAGQNYSANIVNQGTGSGVTFTDTTSGIVTRGDAVTNMPNHAATVMFPMYDSSEDPKSYYAWGGAGRDTGAGNTVFPEHAFGSWGDSTAINRIDLIPSAGTFSGGEYVLYGEW